MSPSSHTNSASQPSTLPKTRSNLSSNARLNRHDRRKTPLGCLHRVYRYPWSPRGVFQELDRLCVHAGFACDNHLTDLLASQAGLLANSGRRPTNACSTPSTKNKQRNNIFIIVFQLNFDLLWTSKNNNKGFNTAGAVFRSNHPQFRCRFIHSIQ